VDERIVSGIRLRKGRIVDSQADTGGWPEYRGAAGSADTDGDGIPDAWELAHGLNPKLAADASRLAPSGYTNLEEYINELAR
jgi:hypothetical protein